MAAKEYTGAVEKLLEIGTVKSSDKPDKWLNYPKEYGLTEADIPELIRLATDKDLFFEETEEEYPEEAMWGAIHALRALGQLKATEAVEPLLEVFKWDDDYTSGDLPFVFGLIGPAAIPALTGFIGIKQDPFDAGSAVEALAKIATNSPESRDEVIKVLTAQLAHLGENDPILNAFIVSSLTDLKAEEALPLIEEAYDKESVDDSVITLHSIRYEFGKIDKDEYDQLEGAYRAARRAAFGLGPLSGGDPGPSTGSSNGAASKKKDKAKAKRKMAKASQRKNRKRK